MGWLKQETAYERRMRELEEEADRIRKNMQNIMKDVDRGTTSGSRTTTTASGPVRIRSSVYQRQPYNEPSEDASQVSAHDTPAERTNESTDDRAVTPGVARAKPAAITRQERLANYLASGSFGKGGSLSRERRIQRNKAIFMAIFALLAMFSLYSWLK